MDADNGLELSLGLSCGGLSGKSKANSTGGSPDNKTEEGDRSTKVVESFKNFLHPSTQKNEASASSQKSDSVTMSQENFFSDLSKTNLADTDASTKGFWVDEEPSNKRKLLFPEPSNQKKHEKDVHNANFSEEKDKTSHLSINTEDGSTAENEDVAESEVSGSSGVAKQVRSSYDADVKDLAGHKRNTNGSSPVGEELKVGKVSYGMPFSVHPINVANAAYPPPAKDSNSVAIPGSVLDHTPPNMVHPGNSGSLPVLFGYSPVQLPVLDKERIISQPQKFQPPYASRGTSNSAAHKSEGKQHGAEEGSSNQNEDTKGSNTNLREKDASSDQPNRENSSLSLDFSAIKPGIAAEVKFGGSGTCPNLPWVSTTGSGPHGRTISGVTYRYSANMIRIVCACHGSHMSPQEFIRHASDEYVSPEASVGMTAASAHG